MSMTWDEYAREKAIAELHDEAVMRRAAQEQCIFLFVEGDSEEHAFPILMQDVIDFEALGVKIANYNGHGNLRAALRLLKLTLSRNRPVIITHDNDPPSVESVERCRSKGLFTEFIHILPIPTEPVVTYSTGNRGGSFEEAFPIEFFLEVVANFLPDNIISEWTHFKSTFDPDSPRLKQLQRFSAEHGFTDWSSIKIELAESLAVECEELPPTFTRLAELIRELRELYPVVHPNVVEVPKVHGLTYFPERKGPQNGIEGDE